jgi:geranylgeranyl pyrophosphate synthase
VSAVPAAPADLAAYLGELRRLVDEGLARVLPAATAPTLIVDAMRYPLMGAGKRLRPCLALAVADAAGARARMDPTTARALALPGACALEMVHTYSLVHDDLPAMDDDALRRGRPTTHIMFGDGLAILAGDGLLTEAFAVIAASPSPALPSGAPEVPPARRLQAVAVLASAAGATGMVGGQAIDLAAAGRVTGRSFPPFDAAALEDMHRRKTGALIRASAVLGAIAVGADEATCAAVDQYARELGLAFQIVDDLLDVEGSPETLGKTAGKDAAAGKPTFPAIHGIETSRRLAADCVARAKAALAVAGLDGRLGDIAEWSLLRRS